jgi:hypothetical protein
MERQDTSKSGLGNKNAQTKMRVFVWAYRAIRAIDVVERVGARLSDWLDML